MKIFKHLFSGILFMVLSLTLNAQDQEPAYFILDYMKVKPGQTADYLALEQDVWKIIHKERIKNGKIASWSLYELRFPAGTDADYDYVTVTSVQGWQALEDLYEGWDETFKVLTKEQVAIANKTGEKRDHVRSEVWAWNDGVFGESDSPPKYLVTNYMAIPEGRMAEYMAMEKDLIKPMQKAHIDAGGRAGWGIYNLVFPYGAEVPYQVATVDFYNEWKDLNSGNFRAFAQKVHPNKSFEYIIRQINETRTLLRGDLWSLVDHAE